MLTLLAIFAIVSVPYILYVRFGAGTKRNPDLVEKDRNGRA